MLQLCVVLCGSSPILLRLISGLCALHAGRGKGHALGGEVPYGCWSCSTGTGDTAAMWVAWQAGSSTSWCFTKASLNL